MNKAFLDRTVEEIKEDMGSSLKNFSVINSSGQSIVGINADPQKDAYVMQSFMEVSKAITDARYAIVEFNDDTIMVVGSIGEYVVLLVFDPKKIMLGMFINVILPKISDNLKSALY